MKTYSKPEIVITAVSNTDVITVSGSAINLDAFKKADKGYSDLSF